MHMKTRVCSNRVRINKEMLNWQALHFHFLEKRVNSPKPLQHRTTAHEKIQNISNFNNNLIKPYWTPLVRFVSTPKDQKPMRGTLSEDPLFYNEKKGRRSLLKSPPIPIGVVPSKSGHWTTSRTLSWIFSKMYETSLLEARWVLRKVEDGPLTNILGRSFRSFGVIINMILKNLSTMCSICRRQFRWLFTEKDLTKHLYFVNPSFVGTKARKDLEGCWQEFNIASIWPCVDNNFRIIHIFNTYSSKA